MAVRHRERIICLQEAFFVTSQYEEDRAGLIITALLARRGRIGWLAWLVG